MPRGEGTPQRQSQSDSTGGDNAQVAAATDTSASAQRDYSAAVAALNEMTNTGELSSDFPSAEQLLGPSEAA